MKNFDLCRKGYSCTKLTEKISLDELVQFIKDHPQKDLIKLLREADYKSKAYTKYKGMLPYVMPHATFLVKRQAESIDKLTGYVYLDIDKGDLPDGPEAMKKTILEKHADKVAVIGTSVGGSGIFIYVRIANPEVLTTENFDSAHHHVRNVLFHGIPTDANASGVARVHIIPADPEVYVNLDAKVLLPDTVLQDKKTISTCKNNNRLGYTRNDKFVDIGDILDRLKTETMVDIGDLPVLIRDIEYSKTFVPRVIPDGKKHATYRALVNSIMFNNPDFTLLDILSYINYVNNNHTQNRPMIRREMERTVEAEFDRIKKTGEFKCTRIKRYHTNPNDDRITRIRNAAKARGGEQVQKSTALIVEAIRQLKGSGCERPTIKKVTEILKGQLSEVTIGRHWRTIVPKRIVK